MDVEEETRKSGVTETTGSVSRREQSTLKNAAKRFSKMRTKTLPLDLLR